MTTTPKVRFQTVDDTGNLDEMDLETLAGLVGGLLPTPKPVSTAPTLPNPLRLMEHHKAAEAADGVYELNVDVKPNHFLYAEVKGKTYEVKFQTGVTTDVLEVATYLWGPGQFAFSQVTKWATAKPQAGEEGWLVTVLHFYAQKPVWTGFWAPVS